MDQSNENTNNIKEIDCDDLFDKNYSKINGILDDSKQSNENEEEKSNYINIISSDNKTFRISLNTAKCFGMIKSHIFFNSNADCKVNCDSNELRRLIFLEKYRPGIDCEDYLGSKIAFVKDRCILNIASKNRFQLCCCFPCIKKTEIFEFFVNSGKEIVLLNNEMRCVINIHKLLDDCAKNNNITHEQFVEEIQVRAGTKIKYISQLMHLVLLNHYAIICAKIKIDVEACELIIRWMQHLSNSKHVLS